MNQYKFKQNDLPKRLNSANGKNEHCFSVTLYVCACDAINRKNNYRGQTVIPNKKAYENIYLMANRMKILKDETGKQSHGAYVVNPVDFFQLVLDHYSAGLKVRQVHRLDYEPGGSWKTGIAADYLVINIKTAIGGHFRELNYDPWHKEVKGLYIKSVRGFVVEEM